MGRIGVVTGLLSEAACFASLPDAPRVLCSGARPERAARAARQLVEEGCTALVSFGLAGGLAPGIGCGAVVLADSVVFPDGRRLETDARWRRRLTGILARGGLAAVKGGVVGSDVPVLNPKNKAELHASSNALAVDMESHITAAAAFESGLPFLVMRAISDPSGRNVPGWVMGMVEEDGRVDVLKSAFEAACRPWDIPSLILLGLESARATHNLRRAATIAGSRMGVDG